MSTSSTPTPSITVANDKSLHKRNRRGGGGEKASTEEAHAVENSNRLDAHADAIDKVHKTKVEIFRVSR